MRYEYRFRRSPYEPGKVLLSHTEVEEVEVDGDEIAVSATKSPSFYETRGAARWFRAFGRPNPVKTEIEAQLQVLEDYIARLTAKIEGAKKLLSELKSLDQGNAQ